MVKKILVIDDDVEDLQTVESVLKNESYEVTTVTNGASALDALKNGHFDLVLLDIQMPTLSGYELLQLLKKRIDKKAKIFYVTIVPEKEVDMTGIDGLIQKPFSMETFIRKVKEALPLEL